MEGILGTLCLLVCGCVRVGVCVSCVWFCVCVFVWGACVRVRVGVCLIQSFIDMFFAERDSTIQALLFSGRRWKWPTRI